MGKIFTVSRPAVRFPALALALVFLVAPAIARAQGFDFSEEFRKYLRYLPPVIERVSIAPEAPAPNETTNVSAIVRRFPFPGAPETEDTVNTVSLAYSADDGATWETLDMDQDGDNENLWTAEIPEQPAGARVRFRLTAMDTAGNIARELPLDQGLRGFTPDADPPDDPLLRLTRVAESQEAGDIPRSLDITGMDFGYDAGHYYFRIQFAGHVDPGTFTPINAQAYLLAIINGPLLGSIDIVNHTWAWYYAPLAEMAPPVPGIGKIPGIGFVHVKPENLKKPLFDTTGFVYSLGERDLALTADRALLGDSDMVAFIAGNIRATGAAINSIKVQQGDISPSVVIYFRDHSYTVGEEKTAE